MKLELELWYIYGLQPFTWQFWHKTCCFNEKFPRWSTLNRKFIEGYSETCRRKCAFNILKITSCVLILFGLTLPCVFLIKMLSIENRCNMIEKHIFSHLPEAFKILQRDSVFLVFKNTSVANFELENLLFQSKANCTYGWVGRFWL